MAAHPKQYGASCSGNGWKLAPDTIPIALTYLPSNVTMFGTYSSRSCKGICSLVQPADREVMPCTAVRTHNTYMVILILQQDAVNFCQAT